MNNQLVPTFNRPFTSSNHPVLFKEAIESRLLQSTKLVLAAFILLLPNVFSLGTAQGQSAEHRDIDYPTQILPILKIRCFDCHAGENIKGNLRLDSESGIAERGYSGLPIISPNLDESELVLRIASDDDEYRMPKEDEALPAEEIDLLTQWVLQGASYSSAQRPTGIPTEPRTFVGWLADRYLDATSLLQSNSYLFAAIVMAAFLIYLVLLVAAVVARHRSAKRDDANHARFAWAHRKPFFVVTTVFCIAGLLAFQFGAGQDSKIKITELEEIIAATKSVTSHDDLQSNDDLQPPFAPKPMHPKRLGGAYYRGNDERSDQLFNGGFYRTAELRVDLVTPDQDPVNYGDSVATDQLRIRLRVERSPGTEPAMYSNRTIGNTFVSTSFRGTDFAHDRKTLQPLKAGETWEVTYPIRPANSGESSANDHLEGTLYVYYGPPDHNRIHYAIHYDLKLDENGYVTSDSELWMGSTYNLNGRVVIPKKDEIALHHWFDFRPIPEIVGGDRDQEP